MKTKMKPIISHDIESQSYDKLFGFIDYMSEKIPV